MLDITAPSTLSGIKSYAALLKKERRIPHHKALDDAASEAGYQNWAHALNANESRRQGQSAHYCQIWIVWRDWVDTKTAGWERLWIPLQRPLVELARQERGLSATFISGFRLEGKNCLVDRSGRVHRQSTAQWYAARAARTLQFMDATGLRPSSSRRRVYPNGSSALAIPDHDHASTWFDPKQREYIYIDEPYGDPASEERARWAARYERQVLKPLWGGMHNPGERGTQAVLVAKKDYDLSAIANKLRLLDKEQEVWRARSEPCRYW
ncbi:MAG: hypothetical protein U1E24_02500 [Phenylobacterium sp.]|nr:hypothetical protein [Phenylobacterium sp.]